MTLKERYLANRRNGTLDVQFLYEYYIKNVPSLCRKNKLAIGFEEFVSMMKFINVEKTFNNLDSEFGVNVIYSKEGKELIII